MTLRFGTDGVRGAANTALTPDYVLALGRVAGAVFREAFAGVASTDGAAPPTFLLGQDTRASSPMLAAALSAGLASAGVDVIDLGVCPTAGVAVLVREHGAIGGAVVSASHNPAHDNGIKFFAAGGQKLSDTLEATLEGRLDAALAAVSAGGDAAPGSVGPTEVGRVTRDPDLIGRYVEVLLAGLGGIRLDGIRLVLDCANGAGSHIAPEVFRRAGAQVDVVAADPDGININDGCGATAPKSLAEVVVATGADFGLALDGDADRLIAVDANGAILDGDAILAVCALDLADRGELAGDGVVATVMSNLGLRLALRERNISVTTCPVGDRNVLVALEDAGLVLGGEQSGHVIFRALAPTGCGILTGLELSKVVARTGRRLGDLAAVFSPVPQRLENLTLADRSVLDHADKLWAEVDAVADELGADGDVVVRASGTEPKLRIMVQARTTDAVDAAVDRIVAAALALDA